MPTNPSPAPPPMPIPPAGKPGASNQYDFIMNNAPLPKRGIGASLGGNSTKGRIIIAVVGVMILLTSALVFVSLLRNSNKGDAQALVELTQQQTELIRVATIGIAKATSSSTKNLATTAQLSIKTSQQDIFGLLKKSRTKVNPKEQGLKKDANTDKQLDSAAQNNTFDATFIKILQAGLTIYRADLQKTFKASRSNSEKQVLRAAFNGATLLIGDQATQ